MPKTSKLLAYFNANDIPRPGATFPHAATLVGPRPVAKYKIKEIQKKQKYNNKKCKSTSVQKKAPLSPKKYRETKIQKYDNISIVKC